MVTGQREGMEEIGGILRHLLKILNGETEGKKIQKYIIVLKGMKCGMDSNIMWLFERHKRSPRPNTIILRKVMVVIIGKHSEHDTEPAGFVISTLLEPWDIASCTVLHGVTNTQHRRNVRAVLTVGIVRSVPGQCRHQTAVRSRSDVCHLVMQKQHSVR